MAVAETAAQPPVAPMRRGQRIGLFALLWLAGMSGVVALALTAVPRMVAGRELPFPIWIVVLLTCVQSGILVAFAAALGTACAPKVGLHAPAFEALVTSRSVPAALKPQWLPGLLGGIAGASFLAAIEPWRPAALVALGSRLEVAPAVRLLYGGVTEEVMVRWGLMSLLAWLAWRVLQRGTGAPRPAFVALAIVGAALLFGLGHLPTALAYAGPATVHLVTYILAGNGAFGVLAGWLYWRHGLESAIIAHASTHAFLMMFGR